MDYYINVEQPHLSKLVTTIYHCYRITNARDTDIGAVLLVVNDKGIDYVVTYASTIREKLLVAHKELLATVIFLQ